MLALIASLAVEGEAEKAATNPVIPDAAELFWAAVLFILLWALMRYVLLPPLTKIMRERETHRTGDDEAAERAVAEAEKVRRDYDQTIDNARSEAARLIDSVRAEADAHRAELVGAAEAEVAGHRQEVLSEVAALRAQVLSSAEGDVASVASVAAEKVLGRSADGSLAQSIARDVLASAN